MLTCNKIDAVEEGRLRLKELTSARSRACNSGADVCLRAVLAAGLYLSNIQKRGLEGKADAYQRTDSA